MLPFILIALFSLLAQLVLPWWSLALVAFVVCYWRSRTGAQAFLNGFLGSLVVWLAYALLIHLRTDGIMTSRMSQLFLKADAPLGILLLTALVAGLVGGLAALSGYLTRRAVA